MEGIEAILANGNEITFAALFIGLLLYVMKTNDKREEQYRETINVLSKALAGYEDLKERVGEIWDKIKEA